MIFIILKEYLRRIFTQNILVWINAIDNRIKKLKSSD